MATAMDELGIREEDSRNKGQQREALEILRDKILIYLQI